jgi:serine/threonine-protein kinase HipA
MTSEAHAKEAFVWVWLPGATTPVVAGRLADYDGQLQFNYGKSYLDLPKAIALYGPELPLKAGRLPLHKDLCIPGCLRDAVPDAWGRRVLSLHKPEMKSARSALVPHEILGYLLESGSDRSGALDFQPSSSEYRPRLPRNFSLEELQSAATNVDQGKSLPAKYEQALRQSSTIGGERPKALHEESGKKWIAKFTSSSDAFNLVKAEYIAMRLAAEAGLQVAAVKLKKAADKDVLLVERFDRIKTTEGWQRRSMVSALTLLELNDSQAHFASYEDLAELIRHRFSDAKGTLRELFGRLVFNILCGNTDDSARNHAAFWDGKGLTLTPAYDLCPQPRDDDVANQALLITGNDKRSRLATCLQAAHHFLLSEAEALALIEQQLQCLTRNWRVVCDEADLSEPERTQLWGRVLVNPYVFDELSLAAASLQTLVTPSGNPRKAEQLSFF